MFHGDVVVEPHCKQEQRQRRLARIIERDKIANGSRSDIDLGCNRSVGGDHGVGKSCQPTSDIFLELGQLPLLRGKGNLSQADTAQFGDVEISFAWLGAGYCKLKFVGHDRNEVPAP